MCKTDKTIKLCTCLVDNKKSRRHKKDNSSILYKWTLSKYVGLQKSTLDGLLILPSDKLNDDLTNESMLSALNNEFCFDFEDLPNEGDNLIIHSEAINSFLSFIFQKGQWEAAIYDRFEHKGEQINYGKVIVGTVMDFEKHV